MFPLTTQRLASTIGTALICVLFSMTSLNQAFGQFGKPALPPEDLVQGYDSINIEQSKEWLGVLAGPGFEGRGSGQVGYTKAAHWVAGKVAEFGLEPAGENGTYFQMLPMKRRSPLLEECFISGPDGLKIEAVDNMGFERYTDQQEITGEFVFLNFVGGEVRLDDDLVLRDKIVIYQADDAAQRAAIQVVRKRPLAAIRVITGKPKSISQVVSGRRGRRGGRGANVTGTITEGAATKLIEGLGGKKDWLDTDEQGVKVHEMDQEISLRMRFHEESAAVPNVVAWLEGSDPELNDEYIVIGSHLDHLGIVGGRVFPGADDNGSGSTAVLNIAKAFATNPVRPKRSVLFIWFAAEEKGLVGSKYYCDNPTLPLDKMVCMFNIDMVGRNEETDNETSAENEGAIHLIGAQRGDTDLYELVLEANKHVGFRFELDMESVWNRSDQVNFYNKGVPVAFLFGGFHPDYHQSTDRFSEINFKKLVSAAKLYYVAINLASDHGAFEMKDEAAK